MRPSFSNPVYRPCDSSYSRRYQSYVGTTFHDGYLSRQYREGWKRTRVQTEYSTWNHFVRV